MKAITTLVLRPRASRRPAPAAALVLMLRGRIVQRCPGCSDVSIGGSSERERCRTS